MGMPIVDVSLPIVTGSRAGGLGQRWAGLRVGVKTCKEQDVG